MCESLLSIVKWGTFWFDTSLANVTLHHEMSRNVPNRHFHVFIFSKSKFYAIYNGENHFQIRGLVAELHGFEYEQGNLL